MIGLAISLLIELFVLLIRLMILAVVWTIRVVMWLVSAIARALSDRRSRRESVPALSVASARVPIDPDVRWAIFQRDGYACTVCGSRSDLTIDHVHPVSLGGSNDLSNLRTLCRSCNSAKGARLVGAA